VLHGKKDGGTISVIEECQNVMHSNIVNCNCLLACFLRHAERTLCWYEALRGMRVANDQGLEGSGDASTDNIVDMQAGRWGKIGDRRYVLSSVIHGYRLRATRSGSTRHLMCFVPPLLHPRRRLSC
jgi:hypothetical protein